MKYNLKLSALLLLQLFICFSCQPKEEKQQTVHLKGQLVNFDNAPKTLRGDRDLGDMNNGIQVEIDTDSTGHFDLNFPLVQAQYFRLGRNKLYLSPGDDLEITIDYKYASKGIFKGKGAEANDYLKDVPFPKGGSYLEAGREVKSPDILEIVELSENKSEEWNTKLQTLVNVSEEFKTLEKLRIDLDAMNTLLSFPIYASFKKYFEYNNETLIKNLEPVKNQLNALSQNMDKDQNMQHPNFRDMLGTLTDELYTSNGFFEGFEVTNHMEEYLNVNAFLYELQSEGLTDNMRSKSDDILASVQDKNYEGAINHALSGFAHLNPGKPAFDLILTNQAGQTQSLSEFKGKIIYVDFWATWCGPCIAEEPAFESLKEDYVNKNIAFLSISTDTDLVAWEKYIKKKGWTEKTYRINNADLEDYKMNGIPRYLLIDEDFNLISAFAPRPSEDKVREMIDANL